MNIVVVSGWRKNEHDLWMWGPLLHRVNISREQVFLRFGDCPTGTDRDIWGYVRSHLMPHQRYLADWEVQGKAAGPLRNERMLKGLHLNDPFQGYNAELLIAFPQPGPRRPGSGTWDCVDQARALGIEVWLPKG